MTYTFSNLQRNGGKQAAILSRAMSIFLRKSSFPNKNEFLYNSLRQSHDKESIEKIEQCNEQSRCLSIYCTKCRIRFIKKLYEGIVERIAKAEIDDKTVRERIRFCSALDALIPAEESSILDALGEIKDKYRRFGWSQDGTWARGVIEVELLNMLNLDRFYWLEDKKQRKRDIIIDIGGNKRDWVWRDKTGENRSDYVLIHSYFFMDRGTNEWCDIEKYMKRIWGGMFRYGLQEIDKNKRIEKYIADIISNFIKDRIHHCYDLGNLTIDESLGELCQLTNAEMSRIFKIYQTIIEADDGGLILSWDIEK